MTDQCRHTPGPWRVAQVDTAECREVDSIVSDEAGFGREPFKIVAPGAIYGRSYRECDDNAKLLAAAPDLLQAVKDLLLYATACDGGFRDHPTKKAARAALAKVEATA